MDLGLAGKKAVITGSTRGIGRAIANLLADGFSMAIGNFLGTRAENQYRAKTREREMDEIHKWPEGEREEVRQIYANLTPSP